MTDSRVIVVGGGIAGLVAACELDRNGAEVVVLESASRVGGRMLSDARRGYLMDAGAQFLSSAYPMLSGLIDELGIGHELVETARSVGVVRDGKIHRFRHDRPLSLLFGGLLRLGEWLPLAFGGLTLARATRKLPLNDYSAWRAFDDELAASWSNRHFGKAVTDFLLEPLLEALYFQSPAETSRALAMAVLAFGARNARTLTLTSGIGRLPALLAERLDVRLDSRVDRLSLDDKGVTVGVDTQEYRAGRVILATPAPIARRLHTMPNRLEAELLGTGYSSTINIAIALKDRLPRSAGLDGVYGVWIPRRERDVIAAFAIESAKHAGRASSGELLHVMLSGEAGARLLDKDDDAILGALLSELERYLPGVSGNRVFTKLYRWRHAEPKSPLGRCHRIDAYRRSVGRQNRVILAGDYLGMPFTEGAAETGRWAARTVLGMA